MTYVLLIYRADADRGPTPAEEAVALRGHRAVQKSAAKRGELHAVARLDESRTARTVRHARDGAHEIVDGPFIETKEWLVGFYLVDCASEAEALAHAKSLCTDAHHVIEVRPATWTWKP